MTEEHRIAGEPHGEPLPEGRVGVRVRVPLSGCPSPRWSRDFSARLANELVGHAAIGHLQLNGVVQGDQLVLDGVEDAEAPQLSVALRRAIELTNAACPSERPAAGNVPQSRADATAHRIADG
jgi:hypothetical protein